MKKPEHKRKTFLKGFASSPAFTLAEGGHSPLLCGDEGVDRVHSCTLPKGHKFDHASQSSSPRLVKRGFTLAEVLITLGIIGVVAAVTMPTLIQNYKKHVVETRLEKFYSMINQAIQTSETVNGDRMHWDSLQGRYETNDKGEPDYSKPQALAWFEKYLKPYIKYTKYDIINSDTIYGRVVVYFADGSVLTFNGLSWTFYPNGKNFKFSVDENGINSENELGKRGVTSFSFYFRPESTIPQHKYYYNKGVEPYAYNWNGNRESLFTTPVYGCSENIGGLYCTKLIQLNGWKIPKDYPLKF